MFYIRCSLLIILSSISEIEIESIQTYVYYEIIERITSDWYKNKAEQPNIYVGNELIRTYNIIQQ